MVSSRRWALWVGGALLVAGGTVAGVVVGTGADSAGRQEAIAEKGRSVMPFDLERTTHRFTETARGGTQDVVADRKEDAEQVRLVRSHLKKEAAAFARGDFADPARIHGAAMPGLKELSQGHGNIKVRYSERPDGATLTYTTTDHGLVDALHRWFKAQLGDHGGHAEHGAE